MKLSLIFLLPAVYTAGAHIIDARATQCGGAANNCQRGVSGTAGKPPVSSRLADCSRLNTVTVTPAVYTTTTTTTIPDPGTPLATYSPAPVVGAVTVTPTAVPAYATYCSNPSAYYSACSCAGATPVTATQPTPTVTATVTTTSCYVASKLKRGMEAMATMLNYGRM